MFHIICLITHYLEGERRILVGLLIIGHLADNWLKSVLVWGSWLGSTQTILLAFSRWSWCSSPAFPLASSFLGSSKLQSELELLLLMSGELLLNFLGRQDTFPFSLSPRGAKLICLFSWSTFVPCSNSVWQTCFFTLLLAITGLPRSSLGSGNNLLNNKFFFYQ